MAKPKEDKVNKRKKNPFAWPFSKQRISWINDADSLIAAAAEELEDAPVRRGAIGRAMLKYVKSARLYRRAGLGAMAAGSWEDAAECAEMLGDADAVEYYESQANQIEVFYEEEI